MCSVASNLIINRKLRYAVHSTRLPSVLQHVMRFGGAGAQPGQLCKGGRGLCAARVPGPGLQVCPGVLHHGQGGGLGGGARGRARLHPARRQAAHRQAAGGTVHVPGREARCASPGGHCHRLVTLTFLLPVLMYSLTSMTTRTASVVVMGVTCGL